ncbi:pseudouridine synthase family protein [Thalassotalea agarivorans]|uniref:tRNA pseudouridine32 synthase / 23S rRNA pseudouridine746 synthase n=1 Tax=Thalassotalea agarivorans TaxID=349064 RepID=A0A1I0HHW3_THASX|nr:RluA family pseudouridine synthase [Thalassotalea agarivorans]SET83413.1 tRNA pseudouridine32 synthase / 23S rRNA pseudouridine746 synthase [Thalassotalea agarivorans]
MSPKEFHITVDVPDLGLLHLLKEETQLSSSTLKTAIQKGALWLSRGKQTRRVRRLKTTLQPNDSLHFYYNQSVLAQTCEEAILLADMQDYSFWFKPSGMLSQGSKWSDHLTITRFAETHLQPQRVAFLLHRLDKAASGIIVIAHSKKAARALSHLFEHHQLNKQYKIIVAGHLKADAPIVVEHAIDGKAAYSEFLPLEYDAKLDRTLIQVTIKTGRKHQIRKHAAFLGHPVVGDRLHGNATAEDVDLQLRSSHLSFTCPLTEQHRDITLPESLQLTL